MKIVKHYLELTHYLTQLAFAIKINPSILKQNIPIYSLDPQIRLVELEATNESAVFNLMMPT